MAFREKMAWFTLIGFILTYAVYFGIAAPAVAFGRDNMLDIVWSFGPVAAVHGLISIIGSSAIAIAARRDARNLADERDRAIDRKAISVAYYVMLVGVLFVGVAGPFTMQPYQIVNLSLAVIVVCQIIHDVLVILGYRRGSHG